MIESANNPLVSVLMTVYNRENYLAEAIESVISSSYQNWELIICDDHSDDNSASIIKNYQNDPRIKLYINETTLGDYPNRNKAASLAKGKYLKYLDSDDMIYPSGLETMVSAMEKFPEALLGLSYQRYNEKQQLPYLVDSLSAYDLHFLGGGFLFNGPTGTIIKRSHFEKSGGFDPKYEVASDYAFNLNTSMHGPVVVFQRDLYWWRPHEGQEINTRKDSYPLLNHKIYNYFLSHKDCPLPESKRILALNNLNTIFARKVIVNAAKLQFNKAINYLKSSELKTIDLLLAPLPSVIRRFLR